MKPLTVVAVDFGGAGQEMKIEDIVGKEIEVFFCQTAYYDMM